MIYPGKVKSQLQQIQGTYPKKKRNRRSTEEVSAYGPWCSRQLVCPLFEPEMHHALAVSKLMSPQLSEKSTAVSLRPFSDLMFHICFIHFLFTLS